MNANEYSFHSLYHKICYIELNDKIKNVFNAPIELKLNPSATGFIVYGYIDHECGFTFELLAQAKKNIFGIKLLEEIPKTHLFKLRNWHLSNSELIILNSNNYPQFKEICEFINNNYFINNDLEELRSLKLIDSLRYKENADDVQVILFGNSFHPEVVWVRLENIVHQTTFGGILLNEPNQNFGIHKDDLINIVLIQTENGYAFIYQKQ